MKKKIIFIGALLLILFAFFSFGSNSKQEKINNVSVTIAKDAFSYKGENNKDALAILKEKAAVEQDKSGLVVGINGRKAENKNREYWSFYVNGKMASVGPADYETIDADLIEWKIEKY